jgi:tetratricopeptide (TPR) repeat protein
MPLDPADLGTLSKLLDEALDLSPAEFDAWLGALPEVHGHLLPRLRDMLREHAAGHADGFLTGGPKIDELLDETIALQGTLVGPYRLIREIGHGGMGTVWLAERIDGGLKRSIALKLPRLVWGAGLAERMARERDIGALLEHPHIARLYDAGVDAAGRPFLALEYIDGLPLDEWRVRHAGPIREQLALFLQIIRAVAYAHGRLVVHRDLKPSNVLVTADGQAHLLDFGIAKLLHESAVDDRLTQQAGRVLTPQYASPEQIEGATITVASDIYSLGILLYEQLTGQHPYELEGKGIGAIERAILDDEPPLASTRASDTSTARLLRGELDAILAKAIRRQPEQRYATAAAMADDIDRYLAGERVLARPDSFGYRIRRTLRKHRTGVAAGGFVMISLVVGATIALVQAKRASDAAARAQVVKEFVVEVFRTNEPGTSTSQELRQLPAELLLEHGASLIDTKFANQPQLQAELYGIVGGIFANMGASDLALDYATRNVLVLESNHGSTSDLARANMMLAMALRGADHIGDASERARRALDLARSDDDLRPRVQVLLAEILLGRGDEREGLPLLEQAERAVKKESKPSSTGARVKKLRAFLLDRTNHFEEAFPIYRAALDEAIASEGPVGATAIDVDFTLASALLAHYRPDDARPYREAGLAGLRAGGGPGEIKAAVVESGLNVLMFVRAQVPFEEARAAIERGRATIAAHAAVVPESLSAQIDFDLASLYEVWGDFVTARPLLERSLPIMKRKGEDARDWNGIAVAEALAAIYSGRHDDAAAIYRRINERRHREGLDQLPNGGYYYAVEALNLVMARRFDEADAALNEAPRPASPRYAGPSTVFFRDVVANTSARVQLERGNPAEAARLMRPLSDNSLVRFPMDEWMLHGEVLCNLGRYAEGLRMLEHSLSAEAPQFYPHHPFLARDQAVAGLCALAAGQRQRAVELAAQARESFVVQPSVSPYFKRPLEQLERMLSTSKSSSASTPRS